VKCDRGSSTSEGRFYQYRSNGPPAARCWEVCELNLALDCLAREGCKCGGIGTEPSPNPATATLIGLEPAAGSTLAGGTSFKISYKFEYALTPGSDLRVWAFAFVRDDGRYSPPIVCGASRAASTSGGGGYTLQAKALPGVVGTDRIGRILYEFAKEHSVNLVLLLKVLPGLVAPPGCGPLGTDVPGLSNPTEGTVFPENADQRLNLTLNWFIQP